MVAQPRLSLVPLWKNFERNAITAFALALEEMIDKGNLPKDEVKLNRMLKVEVKMAIDSLDPQCTVYPTPPVMECNNQPDPHDKLKASREDKRPDFIWSYRDSSAKPGETEKCYALECKRLGSPSSPRWVLNGNYVTDGVVRFKDVSHGYGMSCASGAMIGYIQSMDSDDILAEVNAACKGNKVPQIALSSTGWVPSGVSLLEHTFNRSFPEKTFTLQHLWADLR